jgi:hypothetical protein
MEVSNPVVEYYIGQLDDPTVPAERTVEEAILDPQLFVFGEILEHKRIQALNSILVEKVRVMAFGTVREFFSKFGSSISVGEIEKIRKLNILSIFNRNGWVDVPLKTFCDELGFDQQIDVMRLLISMTRSRMIEVRIDERKGTVKAVDIHVFRDVDPRTLDQDMEKFKAFADHVDRVVANPGDFLDDNLKALLGLISGK